MKTLKIFLSVLLALTMVLSMAACGGSSAGKDTQPAGDTKAPADDTTAADDTAAADDTTAGSGLDWLNLGGVNPIVAEGTEKTLSILCPVGDEYVDTYKERWQYIYTTEVLNINLDMQIVPSSAWGEKLPLILADTENLPDLIMNAGFNTAELLRYGTEEGLLMDIAPYITEEYMPCLTSLLADYPEHAIPWTDSEGHIYGVADIRHTDRSDEMQWHYLNYQWMVDCGLDPVADMPETLDEFTELMRTFKEVKSAEFGEEIYPIGGKFTGWTSVMRYLLAGCGFVGNNRSDGTPGMDTNMRNGKVTLPVADREGWTGVITTLKTWYDEGLIHPEFFTAEQSVMDARIVEDKIAFTAVPPFVWLSQDGVADWWGAPLLTSEWCEKPGVFSNAAASSTPKCYITTNCKEVELALAFYDWFFQRGDAPGNSNAFIMFWGPFDGYPEAEMYPEFAGTMTDGGPGSGTSWVCNYDKDLYLDNNDYCNKRIVVFEYCSIGYWMVDDENGPTLEGSPEIFAEIDKWMNKGAEAWEGIPVEIRCGNGIQFIPYRIFNDQYQVDSSEEFPHVTYFDSATTERVIELKVQLQEYAMTETAKFVVGERDISELNDYFDEMDNLGAQEYIQIHQDYFDAVKG